MKQCGRCFETKPSTDFYRRTRSQDGLQTYCKGCHKDWHAAYITTEAGRAVMRAAGRRHDANPDRQLRHKTEEEMIRKRTWARTDAGKASKARYAASHARDHSYVPIAAVKNPEKVRARWVIKSAVRRGKIEKPRDCEVCGASRPLQGHHRDYASPLVVVWLCSSCHGLEHRRFP